MALNLKKYQKLKSWSQTIADSITPGIVDATYNDEYVSETGLTSEDLKRKVNRFSECSNILEVEKIESSYHVTRANFCKQQCICPLCASRAQVIRRRHLVPKVEALAMRYKPYLVTFTIKNGPDLYERLNHLRESMKRFRKMGQRRILKNSGGEWSKVRAGFGSVEIKRGKNSGDWHVHFHSVLFVSGRLDYALSELAEFNGTIYNTSKIQREWMRATGDSLNIDIRPMRHIPTRAKAATVKKLKKLSYAASIAEQSKEVLKYVSKLGSKSADDILEIIASTHERRMFSSYGELRKYKDKWELEPQNKLNLYNLVWNKNKNRYGNIHAGPITEPLTGFADIQKEAMQIMARTQGKYRKRRRTIFRAFNGQSGCAWRLNKEREKFANEVKRLMQHLEQWDFRNRILFPKGQQQQLFAAHTPLNFIPQY